MAFGWRSTGVFELEAEHHEREAERLAALEGYDILDTLPEEKFNDLVELASRILDAPVSLISLVAKDRQWFKAKTGFEQDQTGLENSICAHGILADGILEIPDTQLDARTADMPIVAQSDMPVRFYAGSPLITPEGLPLGMLCVLDTKPRYLSGEQRFALKVIADQVMAQLDLRRTLAVEKAQSEELRAALAERDLLAREVDHRVKNSLAIVAAFLNMQRRNAKSEEAQRELDAASRRVAAIGHLHEELYLASEGGLISLAHFAQRLAALLAVSAPHGVNIRIEMEPIRIEAKRASAFAIVVNEFVTNAFKHAFIGRNGGEVRLSGRYDKSRYHFVMEDDGHGANGSRNEAAGLGRRIIQTVGRQLGAASKLEATPGGYRFETLIPSPVVPS